jgi:hypothetical protein
MSASPDRRRGYTLIELVAAVGTSAILVGGLTSTLFIASHALTPDVTATDEGNRSSLALNEISSDLRLALSLTERTAHAVAMTVPDRTGDGLADTIRYSWAGSAGNPLLRQFNGEPARTIATGVQDFNVVALTRAISATSCILPGTVITYLPPAENKAATPATSLDMAAPTGLVPGNLMVAAVVVDGSVAGSLAAPPGWAQVNCFADSNDDVTLAVWWKLAGASEAATFQFTWADPQKAYGWMMRFGGVESAAPINASSSTIGTSASNTPDSPSVTTTVANAMVVRIGAFNNGDVTIDNAGVANHVTITADESDATDPAVSGAAAYKTQATAGASGNASFALTGAQRFVAVTLAIAPDDGL